MTITPNDAALLSSIVYQTNTGNPSFHGAGEVGNLIAHGLVEGNAQMTDQNGNFAYRATVNGLNFGQQQQQAQPVVNQQGFTAPANNGGYPVQQAAPFVNNNPAAAGAYAIGKTGGGFVAPAPKPKRVVGEKKYDLEQLEQPGDYIFVEATGETLKDVRKAVSSTVNSANRRSKKRAEGKVYATFVATAGQVFGPIVAPSDGVYIVRQA